MSMSISWGAQYPKLKANLRLAVGRLKMLEKKKTEMAVKARPEVAAYISDHKEDRARIRVEHIIREDHLVEAYEILELYCDLLLARFGVIEQMKTPDDSIAEAVVSILWAAPRIACDVAEFKTISDQLTIKYGRPFADSARANSLDPPAKVNSKLIQRFTVTTPPKIKVEKYMSLIAQSAGVRYSPEGSEDGDLIDLKDDAKHNPAQTAYGWNTEAAPLQPNPPPIHIPLETPIGNMYTPLPQLGLPNEAVFPSAPVPPPQQTPIGKVNPPCLPQIGLSVSQTVFPSPPSQDPPPFEQGAKKASSGHDIDYDDLIRRFDQLKKRM